MIAKKRILLLLSFILSIAVVYIAVILSAKAAGVRRTDFASTVVLAITVIPCFFAYLWLRQKLGEMPDQPFLPRYCWAITGWTLVVLLLALLPYLLPDGWKHIHWENFGFKLIFTAIVFAALPAFIEEVLFRDMLLRWMLTRYSVPTAMIVQAISFSTIHLVSQSFDWYTLLSHSTSAILFSLLWLLTKDFIAPMAGHFVWNFTLGVFVGVSNEKVVVVGLLYSDELTSQRYAIHLFKVLAILVVWWAWRRKCAQQR